MTDENTNPTNPPAPPAPEPKAKAEAKPDGSGVFAAYDKTYLRFVGGTHPTKKAATEAAKAAGVKAYEIREV